MIEITSKGNYNRTGDFLHRIRRGDIYSTLDQYARQGVQALQHATPVESSLTANSWSYRIIKDRRGPGIEWFNTNVTDGDTPVAILIQYGHATRSGSYVMGRDFINPAMRPIFDKIANDVWKKVNE